MKQLIAWWLFGAVVGGGVTLVVVHDLNIFAMQAAADTVHVSNPLNLTWPNKDCVRMDPLTGNIEADAPCILVAAPAKPMKRSR